MNPPSKVKLVDFPENQYVKEETNKKQIVIHHTCGGSAQSSIDGWIASQERVATHLVIDRDGTMLQPYSSKYWAYHLGLKQEVFKERSIPYQSIDKISLSIELANYGEVEKHADGKWYNEYGSLLHGDAVTLTTPFKGIKSFEAYTPAQIDSLKQILLYWGDKFGIPLKYNDKMWNICDDALKGTPGVYTHVSYRKDKTDCYPDPKLIAMLQSL